MDRLLGCCGLVCNECEGYKATQANDPEAISRTAEAWSKMFGTDVKPEHVWCDGCLSKSDRKCANCGRCSVRACVTNRGLTNCAECDRYGCETITQFFELDPSCKERLDAIRGGQ